MSLLDDYLTLSTNPKRSIPMKTMSLMCVLLAFVASNPAQLIRMLLHTAVKLLNF